MTTEISNMDDVIDSRDVIAKIKELESLRDDWQSENELPDYLDTDTTEGNNLANDWKDSDFDKWAEWDETDEGHELKVLIALQNNANGSPDWEYGETLIRDSYFVDYAQELAEDVCEMPRDIKWPYTCIDWEKAASELQYDYMQVNFDGVDYWIRA